MFLQACVCFSDSSHYWCQFRNSDVQRIKCCWSWIGERFAVPSSSCAWWYDFPPTCTCTVPQFIMHFWLDVGQSVQGALRTIDGRPMGRCCPHPEQTCGPWSAGKIYISVCDTSYCTFAYRPAVNMIQYIGNSWSDSSQNRNIRLIGFDNPFLQIPRYMELYVCRCFRETSDMFIMVISNVFKSQCAFYYDMNS